MKNILDTEQEILTELKQKEDDLIRIRESDATLIEKWHQLLNIIVPIQIKTIRQHGYEASEKGFATYQQKLNETINQNPTLKKLHDDKWIYLFQTIFGFSKIETISLETAQKITREIADAMTEETFLQKIDQIASSLKEGPLLQRHKLLLDIILPVQIKIIETYGMMGEEGYIQSQRAIMDHAFDPQIIADAQRAQNALFKHAKLIN